MKKTILLFFSLGALLASCSSEDFLQMTDNARIDSNVSHSISLTEALEISDKVLGLSNSTRNIEKVSPSVQYVMNEHLTRGSANLSDTLAYVINYPEDGGFVIVASSDNVYPVLGFSDTGNFSFDNEIAEANFIANIGAYLEEADTDASYTVNENDFDGCYIVSPTVKTSLSQRSPWNKFVIEEHPGCPVGCVAVAVAQVISHSKRTLLYHGVTYQLKSIITAIDKGSDDDSSDTSESKAARRIINTITPVTLPTYSYEQAVDSMAKLLYWIGKDVDMEYSTSGSGAYSYDAYTLCDSLGFNIPSGYSDFDIKKITQYLRDSCIVYMRGRDDDRNAGHAWISDGCRYCVDMTDKTKILDTYIHCDWGWGGSSNGYYSGSVFSASIYDFSPKNYFAVCMKEKSLVIIPKK